MSMPEKLSQEYAGDNECSSLTWRHFIEPYASCIFVQANLPKGYGIRRVTIGGVEANRLIAEEDRWARGEDWYLFNPPKGDRVVKIWDFVDEVGNSLDAVHIQCASTTFENVDFLKTTKEGEPDPPRMIQVKRDWQFMSFAKRGLKGFELTPLEIRRSTMVNNKLSFATLRSSAAIQHNSRFDVVQWLRKPLREIREAIRLVRLYEIYRVYKAWRESKGEDN